MKATLLSDATALDAAAFNTVNPLHISKSTNEQTRKVILTDEIEGRIFKEINGRNSRARVLKGEFVCERGLNFMIS
jgi:hypothetical protein